MATYYKPQSVKPKTAVAVNHRFW